MVLPFEKFSKIRRNNFLRRNSNLDTFTKKKTGKNQGRSTWTFEVHDTAMGKWFLVKIRRSRWRLRAENSTRNSDSSCATIRTTAQSNIAPLRWTALAETHRSIASSKDYVLLIILAVKIYSIALQLVLKVHSILSAMKNNDAARIFSRFSLRMLSTYMLFGSA